ncbi:LysM peptidoglycan-binding domain-containing protein [Acinetobacter dispersus]|nr:LysM peptidoglycan-binding domain-containing protein [Acinetobacter dispersus]
MNTVWADFIAAIPATNSYQESIKYYDNQGRLSKVSDTRQGITTYGYDNAGRVITEILATGSANERRIFTRYNAFDDVTHVLAGEVALDIKSGMTAAQVDQVYEQYAIKSYYDAAGRKTQVLNAAGQLTTFYYDKSGRLTHSINAEGNVVETNYTLFGEVKTTTQYVNSLSKTDEKVTDLAGAAIPAAFSNAVGVGKRLKGGELTTTLSSLVAAIKNASKDNVAKFEYDKLGNISKKTDAESNSVDFLYNQYGELDTETRQVTLNGVKKAVQTAYTYSKRGELKSVITDQGGLNQSASKEYDAFGRVTKETDAKGNITSYDYSADQGRSIQVKSANNSLTKTTYDAWNRVLTVNSNTNISSYSYDDKARTLTVKSPEGLQTITRYNEFGDVIEITAANNGKTTYLYNKDGKKTKETNAASASTSYVYDKNTGLLKESTNALGLKTEYIYDDANRVQSQIVTISATEKVETQYRYDGQGQRLEVIEAYGTVNQRSTQYNYDKAGRLTSVVQDATGIKATTTYAYDETGREIRVVDKGVTTVYSYDALGRRVSEIKDPTGEALKTEYRYDLNGNLTRKIDQAGNSSWYIYDNMNRLSYTVSSLGEIVNSFYDSNDRVIVQYRYTVLQNVSTWLVKDIAITTDITVSRVDAIISTRFVYNKDGLEIFRIDAEGSIVEKQYNELGKVSQIISYDKAITVSGESLTQEAVRAALQTASAGSRTESYYYDLLGRVVYTIDAAGYITRNDYDAANNIIRIWTFKQPITLSRTSTLAQFDAIYKATSVPVFTIQYMYYDKLGRKIYELDKNSVLTRYSYDELGNLVAKKETTISYVTLLDLLRTKDENGAFNSPRPASTPENYDAGLKLLTDIQFRETNYYYDKLGRVKYIIDALGYVTRFNHNALNNVVNTVKYYDVTSLSRSSTLEQLNAVYIPSTSPPYTITGTIYSVTGRKALEYNELGFVTHYSYDALGNLAGKKETTVSLATLLDLLRTKDANGVLTPRPSSTAVNINQAILLLDTSRYKETQYYYDKVGRLAYDINALGYVSNYRYDALGQLISSKQSNLTADSILDLLRTKDASGNFTTPRPELNADNLEKAFKLVSVANYKENSSYYDKDGRLNYSIDAMSYVTRYSYDAYDNVISTIRFKAATILSRSSTLAQLDVAFKTAATLPAHTLIQYGYDALNRKIKETDAEGFSVETGYDAFGNTIWVKDKLGNKGYFYYDALNRNTFKIDAEGYITFYYYDVFGNQTIERKYYQRVNGLDKIIADNGLINSVRVLATATEVAPTNLPYLDYNVYYDQTSYQYDKLNRKTKISDVLGNYEEYTYNNSLTQPATYRNKLGGVYSYVYDRLGRLTQETLPEKSGGKEVINIYEYDAYGNRTKLIEAKGLTEQRVSVYQYDALNRLTAKVGEVVSTTQFKVTDASKPNVKNKIVTLTAPKESYQYDSYGNQILKTDANGAKTFSFYDKNGRKLSEISPVGQLTQWAYNSDGQVTQLKSYETAVALPTQADGALPVAPAGNVRVVDYSYDKVGRQIAVTTPNISAYEYDSNGLGSLTKTTAIVKTYYDANGNVIRVEDGKGNNSYSYYDAIGRKLLSVDAGGYATQWRYDYNSTTKLNSITETKYATKLKQTVNATDQLTQVLGYVTADANNDRITISTLDRKGRVSKTELLNVKYTDGTTTKLGNSTTSFTYNGLDQVLTKTDITGTVRTDYDKLGRETLRTFGEYKDSNNVAVKQRIASVYNGLGLLSSSSVLGTNDAVSTDDRVTQYGYDKLGRLIKELDVNLNHSVDYAYDLVGNQTWIGNERKTSTDVVKSDETLIEYNASGKEITRRVREGSRPTQTSTAITWVTLEERETRYNVFGEVTGKRLIQADSATKATDPWQEVTEYNNQGKVWKSNANNGVTRYYLYDRNGNATLQLDTTGSTGIVAKTPDQIKNLTGVTYTETVYDQRNQVAEVRQPKYSQESLDTTLNIFGQTISRTTEKSTVALTDTTNKLKFDANTQKLSIQAHAQATRVIIKYWPKGSTATPENTLTVDMQTGATAGAFVLDISAIKANLDFSFSYSSSNAAGQVLESSTGTIKRSVNIVDVFSGGSAGAISLTPNISSIPTANITTNSIAANLDTTYTYTEIVNISQQLVNGTQKTWIGTKESYINSLSIKLPELNSYTGSFIVKVKVGNVETIRNFASNTALAVIDNLNGFASGEAITIQVSKKHNEAELQIANYSYVWRNKEEFSQIEDINTPTTALFLNNYQLVNGKYNKKVRTEFYSPTTTIRSAHSTIVFKNLPVTVNKFSFYLKNSESGSWVEVSEFEVPKFIDGNGYSAYVRGKVDGKYEFQYFGFDTAGNKVVGGIGTYTYKNGSSTPIITSQSKLPVDDNLILSVKPSIASSTNDVVVIESNKLMLKNQKQNTTDVVLFVNGMAIFMEKNSIINGQFDVDLIKLSIIFSPMNNGLTPSPVEYVALDVDGNVINRQKLTISSLSGSASISNITPVNISGNGFVIAAYNDIYDALERYEGIVKPVSSTPKSRTPYIYMFNQKNGSYLADSVKLEVFSKYDFPIDAMQWEFATAYQRLPGLFYTKLNFSSSPAKEYTFKISATSQYNPENKKILVNSVIGSFSLSTYSSSSGRYNFNPKSYISQEYASSEITFSGQPAGSTKIIVRYGESANDLYNEETLAINPDGKAILNVSRWAEKKLIGRVPIYYSYETVDSSGKVLNKASGFVEIGLGGGNSAHNNSLTDRWIDFQPAQNNGVKMDVYYRKRQVDINGDFVSDLVNADINSEVYWSADSQFNKVTLDSQSGLFRWSLNELIPGFGSENYEFFYQLYDASGKLISFLPGKLNIDSKGNGEIQQTKWVINNTTEKANQIIRTQQYNAFGEITSETDGNGYTTTLSYNTLGKLVEKKLPTVDIRKADGSVVQGTPTLEYGYDLAGRLLVTKDANGNINKQTYVNGHNLETGDWLVANETHADAGQVVNGYDVFGNLLARTNEIGIKTGYEYDLNGNLVKINRAARAAGSLGADAISNAGVQQTLTDTFSYDELGNRITATNALSNITTTDYDALGRVIQSKSAEGAVTKIDYAYDANILNVNGTKGGLKRTETDALGKKLIDEQDYYGRTVKHTDKGERVFNYYYNTGGWLTRQTSTQGQDIEYTYYTNGYVKEIKDNGLGVLTAYRYDNNGNRIEERYQDINNKIGDPRVFQNALINYDALNRKISVQDQSFNIAYDYDANGNIMHMLANYRDAVNAAPKIQDFWYRYDSMNRFTISMGRLNSINKKVERGDTGVEITYDKLGQRTSADYGKDALNSSKAHKERYIYTTDGYLERVLNADYNTNGVLGTEYTLSTRTNDALGRVKTYQDYNPNSDSVYQTTENIYNKDNQITYQSKAGGNGAGSTDYTYLADKVTLDKTVMTPSSGPVQSTQYEYEWWDSAKQKSISTTVNEQKGETLFYYDINGHISGFLDNKNGQSKRLATYINNSQGIVLQRSELINNSMNRYRNFYYVNGQRIGDTSNDGPSREDYVQSLQNSRGTPTQAKDFKPISSADFDQNFEPINAQYPSSAPTNYVVNNGDTLQSIALSVWGDASMWYMIADLNGLSPSDKLTAGQVLTIPNKVTNIHNNSETFRPYNPGEAIGDTQPTVPSPPPPPKPKKKCGGIAQIVMIVVAIVATVVVSYFGGPQAGAAVAKGFMALGASASTAATAGAVATAATAAAAGSIASQLAGQAMGVESNFSWSQVGVSALTAGITKGVAGGLTSSGAVAAQSGWASTAASAIKTGAIAGVVNYGSNYIANQVFGNNQSFSWAALGSSIAGSVAASGLGASGVFDGLGEAASPYAYALAGANAAATIEDKWFGGARPDYLNVSMAAIANTVGRQFGENSGNWLASNNGKYQSNISVYNPATGESRPIGPSELYAYSGRDFINDFKDGNWSGIRDGIIEELFDYKPNNSRENSIELMNGGGGTQRLPTIRIKAEADSGQNIAYALGGVNSSYNMSAALARVEQKIMLQREADIAAAYNQRTWAERAESAKYTGGFFDTFKYVGQQTLFKVGDAASFGLLSRSDQRLLQVRQGQLSLSTMRNANMTEAGVGGAVTLATGGSFNAIRTVGGAALARIGVGKTAQYYGGLAAAGAGSGILMDGGVQTSERISFGMSNGLTGRSEYDFGQIALSGGIGGVGAAAFGGLTAFAGSKYNVNLQSPLYFDANAGRLNSGLPIEFRSPIISNRINETIDSRYLSQSGNINSPEFIGPYPKNMGPVWIRPPEGATIEQIEQINKYIVGSNEAIAANALSSTGRVATKGQLRREASKAALNERNLALQEGRVYTGHVGHVPDTTWMGTPQPYSWLDLDARINMSIGGQAPQYPIGYKPTIFLFDGGK